MKFAVKLNPATLDRSSKGTISGVLYVQVAGESYPEPDWSDMPAIVLAWWLNAVRSLENGVPAVTCRFMDGPFSFEVRRIDSARLRVSTGPRGRVPSHEADAGYQEVLQEIGGAAHDVLAECARRGWSSAETDDLRRELQESGWRPVPPIDGASPDSG